MHDNDSLFAWYDHIASEPTVELRKVLQQQLGIKVNEHGIMHCRWIRSFYKPIDHMLRDPMHVLVSNGVGNANIACLVKAMISLRPPLPLHLMRLFLLKFNLPHRMGKVDGMWLDRKRFGKKFDSFGSFAGQMLTIVPIIYVFLTSVFDDSHAFFEHVECFKLLTWIIGICFLGPDDSVEHVDLLRDLIADYITAFGTLYPGASTPKLHQLMHVVDNIIISQKLLSCFVTERKHRTTKRAALFTFRHIDNTVITDMVNRQCDAVAHNSISLFSETFLISPKPTTLAGMTFHRSKEAALACGLIRAGDILYLSEHCVAQLVCFWKFPSSESIVAEVAMYTPSDAGENRWRATPTKTIIDSSCIVDAVVWSSDGADIFIIPPFRVTLQLIYESH
jgi:hypothetical protein